MPKLVGHIGQWYRNTAQILMNVFVLLVCVNIAAYGYLKLGGNPEENVITRKYGKDTVQIVYPDMSKNDVNQMLDETWSNNLIYEPFTQFRHAPFNGKFVNVDKAGYRHSINQGAWPPESENYNIFIFGGSTTFGSGVADDKTIASQLQQYLVNKTEQNVKVYNFGRGYYYSSQEQILFLRLLQAGHKPDLALFIDGLNDFYFFDDTPEFTKRLEKACYKVQGAKKRIGGALSILFSNMPVSRLIFTGHAKHGGSNMVEENHHVIDSVINRYLASKKIIELVSGGHGIKSLFVWQPAPTYKYDDTNHLFKGEGYGRHRYSMHGYKQMSVLYKSGNAGENFVWCADMQADLKGPLYVDQVHYTEKFSEMIAARIGETIISRGLM